jgi:imidazolonepropionase-like amidohydrolase
MRLQLLTTILVLFSFISPLAGAGQQRTGDSVLAITGVTIYASPEAAPIKNGVVLVCNGKIEKAGTKKSVRIPTNAKRLDVPGMVITAGFWNSHVHFIEPWWRGADTLPAKQLEAHLETMLTSYGITHAFEVATFHFNDVLALRRRIRSGEINGPSILTTGVPFTPPGGSPIYIAPLKLPEMSSPGEAAQFVTTQIDSGADGIKLWSASPTRGGIVNMPLDIEIAAVQTAHKRGKPVFAHPTSLAGVGIAVAGGVDILTHVAPDDGKPWGRGLLDSMLSQQMSLIPTLKLYKWELERQNLYSPGHSLLSTAIAQLKEFSKMGGQVLFGTDVGYMSDTDPTEEFLFMAQAGLSFRQILESLTTAPAKRFGAGDKTGKIMPGYDADLVILASDPEKDVKAFANVAFTIRKGKIIYSRK